MACTLLPPLPFLICRLRSHRRRLCPAFSTRVTLTQTASTAHRPPLLPPSSSDDGRSEESVWPCPVPTVSASTADRHRAAPPSRPPVALRNCSPREAPQEQATVRVWAAPSVSALCCTGTDGLQSRAPRKPHVWLQTALWRWLRSAFSLAARLWLCSDYSDMEIPPKTAPEALPINRLVEILARLSISRGAGRLGENANWK